MRQSLESQVNELDLEDRVEFVGGVDFDRVLDFYKEADILVLATATEGWPKAIAEAMTFGLICIGGDEGWVPEMLGDGRGIVVRPGDVEALTDAIRQIALTPDDFEPMSKRAADWAKSYSLEGLRDALRGLIINRWKVSLEYNYRPID